MIRKRFPVLAFALLTVPAALHAQSVSGRVVDRATDRPIPATSVVAENGSGRVIGQVLADSAGRFTVALRGAGRYRLRADRIGYQPVTSAEFDVSSAEALAVDLHLSAGAVELDPLTITSRAAPPHVPGLERAGFYQRERTSPGVFMRREEVIRKGGTRMSELLTRVPGVRRVVAGGRAGVTLGRQGPGGRSCSPAVFLDGQPIARPEGIDEIIAISAVEAVEVYRGPSQTPARFAGPEVGCGVVVIWTQQQV
ncbi:MAG TPA: carboxypeptidase regulatory-like domain-containing protein [Longimicrobium sp.]